MSCRSVWRARAVALLLVGGSGGLAFAAERPAVLDARAAVPPLVYRSPLAAPPGVADPAALSWREANDRVARIGGWKAYAREAQQPAPAASTAPAPEPRR